MTIKSNMALSAARKLGIAMVATGVFTISGGLAAPQNVKAFGISDAFGFVEDVWEIGADGLERAGRAIGEKARDTMTGSITPTGPRRGRRVTGRPVQGGNAALPPTRNSGRPSSALPPSRSSSSSSARPTNGGSALPPPRETSSNNSRPSGSSALPPPRGESSSSSRPSGSSALPPPRRPNETVPVDPGQRPSPITEEDIKPPLCNSKFENCSDDHHHDHWKEKWKKAKKWIKDRKKRGKKSGNGGLRDKSVWGNPVSLDKKKKVRKIKRNGKTFEVHSQGGKTVVKRPKRKGAKHNGARSQMKRNNIRNSQAKRTGARKVQVKRNNVRRVIRVNRNNGRRG
ncbi:MAG: hypothetical protein MPJ78_15280 [Hyphomicrobiaceae bacterium]|nr:hypothetical protein [Hyphomicrobiaceae bacterium]